MSKNFEFKVGLFVIITLLLIGASVGYVAFKKDVFSTVYTFTFSSKSGDGFSEGMPLVFAGFQIGKVQSLELSDRGVVLIKIRVPERHIKWTRSDSIFILERPLIGSPKIVVYTENLKSAVLTPEMRPTIFSVDNIDEAIQKFRPILQKVDIILDNVVSISTNLSRRKTLLEMAVGDRESVNSINELLKKSKDIGYELDSILKNAHSITQKTDRDVFGTDGILATIRTILLDISGKLKTLESAIDDVPKITSHVSKATIDLDKLRKDIDTTIDSTNKLIADIGKFLPGKKEREIKLP
jgi:phospholipid/cholesterol/gamma-HCH transport system substrate-binding protein